MSKPRSGGEGGPRRALFWAALVAALTGLGLLVIFYVGQEDAPQARSSGTTTAASPSQEAPPESASERSTGTASAANGDTQGRKRRTLTASRPVSIAIDAIDVRSEVIKIGKNPDGTLAVPEGDNINKAAWFVNSPTPGQLGPSVIEGHIDTDEGPSVFYRLADLESGDTVKVTRADGTVVTFTVTGTRDYPTKDTFPTELVYGGDLTRPTLRLITCSNFDPSTGHYAGNTVVYSTRTNVRTPSKQD